LSLFSRLALSAAIAFSLLAVAPIKAADAPKPDGAVDMAALLKPGPLPELSQGVDTGVPVVEYGSLTCPHCATFALEALPKLKKAYIDTGKVRFIFREFSRNPLDVAAFMLARCVGDDKALAAIDLLFAEQEKWAFVDKPLEPLIAAMRPAGLSHDKAIECLKDNSKAQALQTIAKVATDLVKLEGTPTFIIDGKVYGGELTYDQLEAILQPLVK
jgi:protein-disulfide isomerase